MKALSVKVNVPEQVKHQLNHQVQRQFVHHAADGHTKKLIQDSFEDSYSRLLHPLIARKFRFIFAYLEAIISLTCSRFNKTILYFTIKLHVLEFEEFML